MPTILKRRNKDGSFSFTAQVRVTGFDPVFDTFPDRKAAEAWAAKQTAKLRKLRPKRKRNAVPADIASLTIGTVQGTAGVAAATGRYTITLIALLDTLLPSTWHDPYTATVAGPFTMWTLRMCPHAPSSD